MTTRAKPQELCVIGGVPLSREEKERLEREDFLTWVRILNGRGWVAPSWPKRFGGQERDPARQLIFE